MIQYRVVLGAFLFFIASTMFLSCYDRESSVALHAQEMAFDSAALESFLHSHPNYNKFRYSFFQFYLERNFRYVWFRHSGLTLQAKMFMKQQSRYEAIGDFSFSPNEVYNFSFVYDGGKTNKKIIPTDPFVIAAELSITGRFFEYTMATYIGTPIPRAQIDWYLPRKVVDLGAVLRKAIALDVLTPNKDIAPLYAQYRPLQQMLEQYKLIEKKGNWSPIVVTNKLPLVYGFSSPAITRMKKRLHFFGDFYSDDVSPDFNFELKVALLQFQERYGLAQTGKVDRETLNMLNIPVKNLMQTLRANLERSRWMLPISDTGDIFVVNIPTFRLDMYEKGIRKYNMRVVVGDTAHKTPCFAGMMRYVVFSPAWFVPSSIVEKEIVAGMGRDPNYLATRNMMIDGYDANNLPVIRQSPGDANALGRVKFLFPNDFAIYLHDTPYKNVFQQKNRALSHGCIRVAQPLAVAKFVLRNDSIWKYDSIIKKYMFAKDNTETTVTLRTKIPVFITYFTTWVDEKSGLLHFANDIYGVDSKMIKAFKY